MDAPTVTFVVAVVLVAATAQALAGFGFALIAVPLLVTVLDVRDAVVVVTLLGIINSGIIAATSWRRVPWATVFPMLLGAVAGMPVGLLVLLLAPAEAVRLLVGVTTIVMAVALLRGLRFGSRHLPGELAVGAVSGVLNTSTGTNGPPIVLYLQGREHPPDEFRGALGVFFVTCNVITLGSFFAARVVSVDAGVLFAAASPAIVAGSLAGHVLVRRVQPHTFRSLVFALLFVSAASAVMSAVAGIV
ncbi:MAG TPA: sulfite exporter TauE/SafE family protein [Dehalococcoidia bacterium]|nr:sulfite exporter TauE/SafE family protein [Dehalococcoidia bacterium]